MRLNKDDKAGLYITVIFHLSVIIILLIAQIGFSLGNENTFVLDFSKQEEVEKVQKEEMFREDVSKRLEELLAGGGSIPVRNVAVDRSALKDDRGTNAEELYRDAERLQQELDKGYKVEENDDDYAAPAQTETKSEEQKKESSYQGPSVVSYSLDGRKASKLSIPAYRCMGAGLVTVIITVDNQGNVVNAKVQDDVSSDNDCLRNFAVRAARLSKFSASASAPSRQLGNIVYQFIAQ